MSQVGPTVETGIRLASGNDNNLRTTNQDLDNYFTKKDIWLDRAYLNWHPANAPGLKMYGGKMAQPWFNVADDIWDQDINPEGIAAQYNRKFGDTNVFGSTGAYTLKDNVNGRGHEFTRDLRMETAQVGANLYPGKSFKLTVGGSVYHFTNDRFNAGGLTANGNTSTQFQLYEGFGQLDILGLPIPLTLIGNYVRNENANGLQKGADDAWLAGFSTRIWELDFNYNYRDVGRNGVVGAFTDSDFASGFTASKGSTYKIAYTIAPNFVFTTTYMDAESNGATPGKTNANVDTLMIDLQASF